MKRKRRKWGQLLVHEILRLSDVGLSISSERKAKKLLERIEGLADQGWFEVVRLGTVTRESGLSALGRLKGLHAQAVYLARCLQSGEAYDPPRTTITLEQGLKRGPKGWVVGRWLHVDGDPLQTKVSVAVLEALRQDPEMRFLRCPVCGLWAVVIRRGQKYCSSRCSRVAVDRRRNKQEKRRIYLTMVSYAKKRGVPIEQVRVRKVKGRWRCYLAPPKDLRTIR